jgi:hypothetical protein
VVTRNDPVTKPDDLMIWESKQPFALDFDRLGLVVVFVPARETNLGGEWQHSRAQARSIDSG